MTSSEIDDRRARFADLHESGCFVIPNAWDAGSAGLFANLGFAALARVAWGAVLAAARQIADEGRFDRLGDAASFATLNARF